MKSIELHRVLLPAVVLASLLSGPSTALAFSVTGANSRSTFNAITQWAAEVDYGVIWEPRTGAGMIDFAAPTRYVHDDFRVAVEALVSGEVYGRRNVYCISPSEFQAEAIIDDRMRLVYVIGRPTGRRCVVTYP
ncbi:hypothetical protein P3W85_33665 [Cupriavidus basilensis]|uniref:Toxin co-regulated pilus biosynthesis protein Q C-terminal domain-containing protein n=1 Tax=Cupriavidus basilensis TaxID=68895 RepID=A0ABT6AYZ2_9BURK|nr:hypothetical protein [Cupriavidus basilensis]MDF3837846.1 hypothetical protein [Cupriavidus basilensis]